MSEGHISNRIDSEITTSNLNKEEEEEKEIPEEENKNENKILLNKISKKKPKKKLDEIQIENTITENENNPNDISYIEQALKGDFMPSVLMLEQNLINIDNIINEKKGQTLLHLSCEISYYNVCRCLIEFYKADINIKDNNGRTPFHLLCMSKIKDIMLFSYFINLDNIKLNEEDNFGITPLGYCIINNFNIGFMFLVSRNIDLNHIDKYGNNYLYYAIKNDNIFAFNFLINHSDGNNINNIYYDENITLCDALISNRKVRISNYIIHYFINQIKLESIVNCTKNIFDFPFYNQFNYEAWNTILLYKIGNFKYFLYLLIPNCFKYYQRKNNRNNSSSLYINSEKIKIKKITKENIPFNEDIIYNFKIENLCLYIEKLFLNSGRPYMKYLIILFYILIFLIMIISFWSTNTSFLKHIIGIFLFIILLLNLFFLDRSKLNSENFIDQKFLLSDKENNILKEYINCTIPIQTKNIPTDENEICEICLKRKLRTTHHCLICNRCVKNFYFHSEIYDICIHRNNVWYYLNTIWPLIIIFLLIGFSFSIFYSFIFFIFSIYFLGKFLSVFICIGVDTTYYNAYNYHNECCDDDVVMRKMSNGYFPLPKMFRVSFKEFFSNLFKKKKLLLF